MEDTLRENRNGVKSRFLVVLILVLMEDTLRASKLFALQIGGVLILVLMEDTLREYKESLCNAYYKS